MKGKQSSKPMSVNDSNQSNVGLVDLAEAIDSQGMIGFTRAFVQDLKKGLSHSTPEHLPWMEQLSKTQWDGILCVGMGGSAAGGDFLSALCNLQGQIPVIVERDYVLPSW